MAGYAAWRQRVERELGETAFEDALVHCTDDGLEIQPLYTAGSLPEGFDPAALPGAPPYTRGSRAGAGWRIAQEIAHPEPAAAAAAMRADQRHGADLLWLRLAGHRPHGVGYRPVGDGIRAADAADLEPLAAALEPNTAVVLDAGADALSAAALWVTAARRMGVEPRRLEGSFGGDPLTRLARAGSLPGSLGASFRQLADLAAWAADNTPGVRTVMVAAAAYRDAGATAAQELAFAVATGVEALRRLTGAGLDLAAAARQIDFSFSIGRGLFREIAKLRAARLLWSKVVAAAGGGEAAQAMRLHARTSTLEASRLDPWVNLLRGGSQSLAAAAAGADSILTAPYDAALERPGTDGRRLATNVQHILAAEAALGRVADPAGGSWYLESLTDSLARAAWELFRELERRGGMARCLTDGVVSEQVQASAASRQEAVAVGRELIIGASAFVEDASMSVPPRQAEPAVSPEEAPAPAVHGQGEGGAALAALARSVTVPGALGELTERALAAAADGAAGAAIGGILAAGEAPAVCPRLADFRLSEPYERGAH